MKCLYKQKCRFVWIWLQSCLVAVQVNFGRSQTAFTLIYSKYILVLSDKEDQEMFNQKSLTSVRFMWHSHWKKGQLHYFAFQEEVHFTSDSFFLSDANAYLYV